MSCYKYSRNVYTEYALAPGHYFRLWGHNEEHKRDDLCLKGAYSSAAERQISNQIRCLETNVRKRVKTNMQENDWQGQGSLAGKTLYEDLREQGSWQRKYRHRPWGGMSSVSSRNRRAVVGV